jgi:uncharacterized protein YdaU (DUF1376 family)
MARDLAPPAFMFYPDDFASDGKVEAMSTEGVGCYILLLCKAWRENPPATLPDDDRILARWARVSDERWRDLKAEVLLTFDQAATGRLVQRRLLREYEKQRKFRRQHSLSGKLGAAERWRRHSDAIAQEDESEIESPDYFELFWKEFPRGRKKSKARARTAFDRACGKVPPEQIIAAATEYAASDEGRGAFVKMPETWLNGECWTDDREAWKDRGPKNGRPQQPVNAGRGGDDRTRGL